jgi:excisionase family DNA binding protein
MSNDKLALSVKEVAKQLGLSTDSVYDAVHRGQIPAVRLSQRGRILIPRAGVEKMMSIVSVETSTPRDA